MVSHSWIERYRLKQALKAEPLRAVRAVNLENARSVGLLIKLDSEETLEITHQYIKYLKGEHGIKNVHSLAIVSDKSVPEFIKPQSNFDVVTSKDMAWGGKPKSEAVNSFVERQFDILIDLSQTKSLPIVHCLIHSAAKLKVGGNSESHQEHYDLFIEKQSKSITAFIKEVNYYLLMLNKSA